MTYGQSLPDCHLEDNVSIPPPSKFSWVEILGKDLELEVINLSVPGSSNRLILNTILNTDIRQDDSIFIQWTFMNRSTLFTNNTVVHVGPWIKKDIVKYFYLVHDDDDLYNHTLLNIHHADLYLKTICKSVNHLIISSDETHRRLSESKPDWFSINYIPVDFYHLKGDVGRDGFHPGMNNHKLLAKHIIKEIYDTKN